MRIALISDIHEDIANLEKAMLAIENHGYDLLVCLGDITGYSPLYYSHEPNANACIDLLRSRKALVVAGNHDLYTCGRLPSYHAKKNIPKNWYSLSLNERIRLSKNKVWLYQEEVVPALNRENLGFLTGLKEWETIDDNGKRYLFTHFFLPDMA
ncbi:MAG: metallophosphoesterase family protein, partial [Bacteroidota bacterium]